MINQYDAYVRLCEFLTVSRSQWDYFERIHYFVFVCFIYSLKSISQRFETNDIDPFDSEDLDDKHHWNISLIDH